LYSSRDSIFQENEVIGAIREDDKKQVFIWYFNCDSSVYRHCGIDHLLYNFSLSLGDTINIPEYHVSYSLWIVMKIDTITLNNKQRKQFFFGYNTVGAVSWMSWVEGIGYLRGLLYPTGAFPTNGLWNDLVCFRQDGREVYHDGYYPGCMEYISTFVKQETVENTANVSPNPITDQCKFVFPENGNYEKLEIFDLSGRPIYQANIKNCRSWVFNKGNLKPGLYIYRITGNNKNALKGKLLVN
jgi:hypothetical protein